MFAKPGNQFGFSKNVFSPQQPPNIGGTPAMNPQSDMNLARIANPQQGIMPGEHDRMSRGKWNPGNGNESDADRKRKILAAILGGAGVLLG